MSMLPGFSLMLKRPPLHTCVMKEVDISAFVSVWRWIFEFTLTHQPSNREMQFEVFIYNPLTTLHYLSETPHHVSGRNDIEACAHKYLEVQTILKVTIK